MNKIGWCSKTWNPVWGCLNHCEYCYARKIAKRFSGKMAKLEYKNYIREEGEDIYDIMRAIDNLEERIKFFRPTFLDSQFYNKFPKKPQRIFVGSMSEIAYWENDWMERILNKIRQCPQHTFIFLTKNPRVYQRWSFPSNCWLGVTITRNPKDGESLRWDYYQFKQDNPNNLKFYCFEPLLIDMELQYYLNLEGIDWVIIGLQTNPFKKINKKAITDIIDFTKNNNIPLFLKDSIYKGYPDLPIIKEFPNDR